MNISVIIPCLNEEPMLERTLSAVIVQDAISDVVVADGGSSDRSIGIAIKNGAKVTVGDSGRGTQLNAGWRASDGEILWFLHADTRPDKRASNLIIDAFKDNETSLTAFRLKFESADTRMRLVSLGANLRSIFSRLPYGDQGLAVRRRDLEKLGGLPNWEYLEDVWLVEQMRRIGRIKILPGSVSTSPRRYKECGVWNTVRQHNKIMKYWNQHHEPMPGGRI
ncbi:MAG: glycosyltransferase family 2 protein [Calditrichaeota bacterium]|jgi:rSAM/selenodomain-associated transferase 2|nr:glycosyltransferase family 2 protein [Calditrichota bacterium]MBT7616432.1 glycosyltransferase family 2 protein [Calditrichota bacterium]MBT7789186.1 glycosyltransferase family 2 protein [Calditrichota bacterium]